MATKSIKSNTASGKSASGRASAAKASSGKKTTSAKRASSKDSGSTRKKTSAAKAETSKKAAASGGKNAPELVQEYTNPVIYYEIFLWIVLAFSILLFISYLGIGGFVGKAVSSFSFGCFGTMAYLLPFLLFFMTAFLISNRRSHIARIKAAATGGLYLAVCGIMELLMLGYTDGFDLMEYYEAGAQYKAGGGLVGGLFVNLFCPAIGVAGAYIMLVIMAIICLVLITQRSLFAGMKHQGSKVYRSAKEEQARRRERAELRREYFRENPDIFTISDGTEAERDAEYMPVNFSILPKEPRMTNRITGVTSDTDLSGLPRIATDEIRQVMPKKTEIEAPYFQTLDGEAKKTVVFGAEAAAGMRGTEGISNTENTGENGVPGKKRRTKAQVKAFHTQAQDDKTEDFGFREMADFTITGAVHPEEPEENVLNTDTSDRHLENSFGETAFSGNVSEASSSEENLTEEFDFGEGFDESTFSDENFADDLLAKSGSDQMNNRGKTAGKAAAPEPGSSAKQEEESSRRSARKPHASQEEIKEGIENVEQEIEKNAAAPKPSYVFPSLHLLKKPSGNRGGSTDAQLREMAQKLQQILHTFGVNVKVTNVSCGPSVTRYELMPEMGVKVSKIVNLADDIKLNLAAADIRIEAPIPGKAAVGIEVPNKESSGVLLRELLESEEFRNHPSNLAYAVGKDIGGKIIVSDIAKMPHLLIAGATGSGKSVFINTLIMSIIYKAKPEDVKMIMIDPKVVELSVYNGIPHLFIPVVTDPKKAAGALNWGVAEMMQRYEKFANMGVRDLKGYNAKIETIKDIEEENKPEKLPQIVIIVDELADLMMVASGEVEDAICRLAQLARAAGIHLVIATQRPSVDVITGLIKANMPSRIAFSVSSGVDSRTILDMNGAEKLLGNGDMLFAPQTYKKPARVQGAFISDKEVSDVVDFLKNQNSSAEYSAEMEAQIAQVQKSALAAGGNGSDVDELFADAGKFIIEKDKASIGMLQRWFKIGFNRAARIMDQLSDAGVVGPEEGTKPRKVLMSMEQFENYLEEN